eukprot:1069885-Lingulodinium_polyedra.AAC.1
MVCVGRHHHHTRTTRLREWASFSHIWWFRAALLSRSVGGRAVRVARQLWRMVGAQLFARLCW